MLHEPIHDAPAMKPAETLEPRHLRADLELLEADGALGVVDAVLFGGAVDEHACAAGAGRGGGEGRCG
jgi:hypothetical protein